MKLKELNELKKYKTDKFDGHQYLDLYDNLFSPIADKVLNVLEVGIQKGESLLLWKDLFPKANIFGCDIDLSQLTINKNQKRIKVAEGNAYTDEFIKTHFSNMKFDIIIDDGSHLIEHMTFFAQKYPSLLKDDGIFVIEDIAHFPHAEQLRLSIPEPLRSRANVVDLRYINNRWDDVLVVAK